MIIHLGFWIINNQIFCKKMYYKFICNLGLCALTPDVHLNLVCNFDSKFNSFKPVLMHKMNKTMAQKWVTL